MEVYPPSGSVLSVNLSPNSWPGAIEKIAPIVGPAGTIIQLGNNRGNRAAHSQVKLVFAPRPDGEIDGGFVTYVLQHTPLIATTSDRNTHRWLHVFCR
jgi:hypothetical protein